MSKLFQSPSPVIGAFLLSLDMYLITKPGYKIGYYSFSRLLKEERIKEICEKSGDKVPDKSDLPVRIVFNQITIEKIEVDERA